MKKAIVFILMLAAVAMASEDKVTINIDGMSCNGCVGKVTKTLEKIEGVKTAQVTLKPGSATVLYDNQQTDSDALMKAVAGLGYKANLDGKSVGEATHCKEHAAEAKGQHHDDHHAHAEHAGQHKCEGADKHDHDAKATTAGSKAGCEPKKCKVTTCPSKAKAGATATAVKDGHGHAEAHHASHADGHVCPTIKECKELIAFHDAMHVMHEALSADNYDGIRNGYPLLAERAEAVKAMKANDNIVTDTKKFNKLRKVLLKDVKSLGKACKGNNNEKLTNAFNKMHDSYVAIGQLAK